MKKMKWAFLALLTISVLFILSSCSGSDNEKYIELVKNGYLGEYTDVTVNKLLSSYFNDLFNYEEGEWRSENASGRRVVQASFHKQDETFADVIIKFAMLDDMCFEVTEYTDMDGRHFESDDLSAPLNYVHICTYMLSHREEMEEFDNGLAYAHKLQNISGSSVKYGAAAEYTGDRSKLYEKANSKPSGYTAADLLSPYNDIDLRAYFRTEAVQNGFLADFTDISVKEFFEKTFGDEYDNLIWGASDEEEVTLTIFDSNLELDMITVNFTMFDDQCFKISSIESIEDPIENTTDMLAVLNCMYYDIYLTEHPNDEQSLLEHLKTLSCSDIQYGASEDYTEDRTQIAKSFGEMPTINLTAYDLLESYELIESANTEIPEESFLGNWKSDSDTLEITSRGEKGQYNVTLTVYPWPAGYVTWTYEAGYNSKTGNLDCRNGVRIDHGKFASDTTLIYDGDGAAEILVSDGNSLSFVSTAACPEDEGILLSPIIFRADGSASAPEPSISASNGNDLSEYYGDYEYGPAFIHIGEGDSDNSLYVHVAYEPTASMWDPMHGNVPIDADAHFLFEADRTPDSQNIDVDGNKIVGAASIEKMSDSSLYVIIYKKQGDEDPYQFMITPD